MGSGTAAVFSSGLPLHVPCIQLGWTARPHRWSRGREEGGGGGGGNGSYLVLFASCLYRFALFVCFLFLGGGFKAINGKGGSEGVGVGVGV